MGDLNLVVARYGMVRLVVGAVVKVGDGVGLVLIGLVGFVAIVIVEDLMRRHVETCWVGWVIKRVQVGRVVIYVVAVVVLIMLTIVVDPIVVVVEVVVAVGNHVDHDEGVDWAYRDAVVVVVVVVIGVMHNDVDVVDVEVVDEGDVDVGLVAGMGKMVAGAVGAVEAVVVVASWVLGCYYYCYY